MRRENQEETMLSNTFIGRIEAKTDEKGRIFVPALYRRILQEMGERRIIMRRDTDNACLVFYPESVWNKKVNALKEALDEWDADDQMLLMQFVSEAECLETDGQGRVLLQKKNLQLIQAKQDVLFVGMMDRFALWSPEVYAQKNLPAQELGNRIRQKISQARANRNAINSDPVNE